MARRMKLAIPDLISPSYFPAAAAVELGFFKKEGLDTSAIVAILPDGPEDVNPPAEECSPLELL